MPVTKTQICNMALTHIGIKQTIADITDANEEAAMCSLHYDNALEVALHEADWGFARRRVQLITEAGTPPDPWTYQYQYPADCVRIIRLDDQRSSRRPEDRWRFAYLTNATAERIILCDIPEDDAYVIYTFLETTDTIYPPPFAWFLSHLLASRIVSPLTGDEKLADLVLKRARMELTRAAAKDFNDEEEGPEIQASWIDARETDVGTIPGIRSDVYWDS